MFARFRVVLALLFTGLLIGALAPATAQAAPKPVVAGYAQTLRTGTDAQVVAVISTTIDTWMVSMGKVPAKWVTVPNGVVHKGDACGTGAALSEEVMWYCPDDQTIYVGLDMIHQFRLNAGRLSPIVILYHENAHRLQHLAAGSFLENQADCAGGAGLALDNAAYGLGVSPFDVPDLNRMVNAIARPVDVSPAQDEHGSYVERGTAMIGGFAFGMASCNNWSPAHPLA